VRETVRRTEIEVEEIAPEAGSQIRTSERVERA